VDEHPRSPSEVDTEVDLLFRLVRARYGDRLSVAELEDVREGVEAIAQAARALRAVRLESSDEPMPPFAPLRAEP
jgi:hypothetical protein